MWRAAALRAGLGEIRPTPFGGGGGLVARANGRKVQLCSCRGRRGPEYLSGTEVAIVGNSGLTIRAPDDFSPLAELRAGDLISTGEESFDAAVVVHGRPDVAHAVLDATTRDVLRELIGGRVAVAGERTALPARVLMVKGELRVQLMDARGGPDTFSLAGALQTLLAISERLQRPGDIPARLAENVRCEPEPQIRLADLKLLGDSQPPAELMTEAVNRALEDESQQVQLWAALKRRDAKSRELLWTIASGEWSEDACAERALQALGVLTDGLPLEALQPILAHALRTDRQRTAWVCLLGLGQTGGATVVEPLVGVLQMDAGELCVAAARGLGLCRSPAAEAPLIEALQKHASPPVRVEAAAALGKVGSAAAVLPLQEALENASEADLRRAARLSVVEIQSRLRGATPGQLSLAEGGEAGELSLAPEDATGRVSLAETENTSKVRSGSRRAP
jgi:hypothetical protein